jgi:aldose 1-epimerase
MPSPEPITIRSGPIEARFLPENGGRMTHLVHDRLGNILVPTDDMAFDPLNWPKAGAYPLFPFHNRLIGAAFTHEGQHHAVLPHPALVTDAQHGPAHRRAWHVVSREADRIELALDYQADADWPFAFRAVQRFTLTNSGLEVGLSLTNTAITSMPGGFGWHPYFAAALEQPASSDAGLIWPVGTSDVPTGTLPQAREADAFPAEDFTIFLSDWRTAETRLDGGARITLSADEALPHLVAHRTSGYLCLEPVSHVAGALGFPQPAQADAGIFVLQSAQTNTADLSLRILPAN